MLSNEKKIKQKSNLTPEYIHTRAHSELIAIANLWHGVSERKREREREREIVRAKLSSRHTDLPNILKMNLISGTNLVAWLSIRIHWMHPRNRINSDMNTNYTNNLRRPSPPPPPPPAFSVRHFAAPFQMDFTSSNQPICSLNVERMNDKDKNKIVANPMPLN